MDDIPVENPASEGEDPKAAAKPDPDRFKEVKPEGETRNGQG